MPQLTDFGMFNYWAIYLQKIVPTIAYHCQILAGFEVSTFAKVMGKISTNEVYIIINEIAFLIIILTIAIITTIKYKKSINLTKVEKVYKILLHTLGTKNDTEIDRLILNSNYSIDIYHIDENPLLPTNYKI